MRLLTKYLFSNRCYKTCRHVLSSSQLYSNQNIDSGYVFLTSKSNDFKLGKRYFSEYSPESDDKKSLPPLMDFPKISWPSLIQAGKNWIFTSFIIRPHLDPTFNMPDFIEGSKQAVEVISTAMGESDFKTLENLVSKEAYEELHKSVSKMSVAEREQLIVSKEDIYFSFPFQVGVMFNDDDKRWVEITMCYHALRGYKHMKERGDSPPMSLGFDPEYQKKLYICNYRFIREYTKGVADSSWIVNVANHFKTSDLRRM